jgi:DNA repair protein RecN (Recombination protein N)
MLYELSISDFAIIESLTLRFSPAFNVLTGETGAGKSIVVDAVSMLLGARADTGYVRTGSEESRIEGVFHPSPEIQRTLGPVLAEYGLVDDGDVLILAREIRRSGKSVSRVNGRAVALAVLREIGGHLVDIHGQGDHLSLLRVREHVNFIDRYAGLDEERLAITAVVAKLRRVRSSLAKLLRDERELARRVDLLEYQLKEIRAARLEAGEEEELSRQRHLLANAERLSLLADAAYRSLYEGEEGSPSTLDAMGAALEQLKALARLDSELSELHDSLEASSYQVEEIARNLRTYRDEIEYDPARLRKVEERLDLIYGLKRKYGDSVEYVLRYADEAAQELDQITHSEERIAELRAEEVGLLEQVAELGQSLSSLRREAAQRLEQAIEADLDDLMMKEARFQAQFRWVESEDGLEIDGKRYAFDGTGLDKVEFLVSPNLGEPPKPLVKIASGGETSRLMLAMKSVLTAADPVPTLIFDEIDSGIGGRAGGVVGSKLWELSRCHQVLCVTHLAQMACFADAHYSVAKETVGDRTTTSATELEGDRRVEELALMLDGTISDTACRNVRELIERVQEIKGGNGS